MVHAELAWRRTLDGQDVRLLADLCRRTQPEARILDVGCGAGVPVALRLTALDHDVVGVDLSIAQLVLAGNQCSSLRVVAADMAALPLGSGTFNALVSYYAVIHVPREDHPTVFKEFRRVLRGNGWALICLGSNDNPQQHDPWLGTPMYWSHFDAEKSLALLEESGFRIEDSWEIPDPMEHGTHRFVLAQRA
jgi:ubiquinone/menaquinone biosynthesis C-methylase UbiE